MDNPRPAAAGEFLIKDRQTLLRLLDMGRPELAKVREELDAGNVEAAGRAFINWFRTRDMTTPLLRDWSKVPQDPHYSNQIAQDCLRGRLWDGYNVYDVPGTGIPWVNAPLFCLTRFGIFPSLLESWHHTQDARYLRFVIDHTVQYMAAYPIEGFAGKHSNEGYRSHYLVGPPTWWCLLPNRLEQWATALAYVRCSPLVSDEELLASLHRMLQEIRYLMTQVPFWVDLQHNVAGYMTRVIGILCRVFEDFAESAQWQANNARWLAQYVGSAFYPDGLYKELTLGYSSSVVAQVARIAHVLREVPQIAMQKGRLGDIMTAMIGLAKPSGSLPSLGDSWGRSLSAILYPPLIEWLGVPWMAAFQNGAGSPPFLDWPARGQPAWGGYYAMRSDWSAQAKYLMIDGGPWGTTHQHMDKLSFVLTANGADFITDPGNTLYANNEPDARLSTLHAGFLHNTITVDGVDEFVREESPWAASAPLDNLWEQGEGYVLFAGRYEFSPLKDVRWERRVLFVDRSYWLLQDVLTGSPASVAVEQNFQFEPDIELTFRGTAVCARAPGGAVLMTVPLRTALEPRVFLGEEASHKTGSTQYKVYGGQREFGHGRGWTSRVTNKIMPAPALTYCGRVELPCLMTLAFFPLTAHEDMRGLPTVTQTSQGSETVWALPTRGGELRWHTSLCECSVRE